MSRLADKIVEVMAQARPGEVDDIGPALKQLRRISRLTQKEMANRLGVQQSAVSKIENGGDTHLSTIRRYVEALGASLRIDARFPPSSSLAANICNAFDIEYADDDQLVFPIFSEEPFRPMRDVVLSIKPRYTKKIFSGEKTVELRRRFPVKAPRGTVAYIYSTSPVRAMVGHAGIKSVLRMPVEEIWRSYRNEAQIGKEDFFQYFEGLDEGFAVVFERVRAFENPLPLAELRERFGFEPPQSYLYAKHELREALKDEPAVVSH